MRKSNSSQRDNPTLFRHRPTGHLYTISDGPFGRYLGPVKIAHPHGTGGTTMLLDFWKPGVPFVSFKEFEAVAQVGHRITQRNHLTASAVR